MKIQFKSGALTIIGINKNGLKGRRSCEWEKTKA
jgi:hypothetical protein